MRANYLSVTKTHQSHSLLKKSKESQEMNSLEPIEGH